MKLKILLLSHKFYPDVGGIETCSEMFASAFSEAGHTVHILTWSEGSDEKIYPFTVVRNPNCREILSEHQWSDIVFENNPCLRLSWPRLFINLPSVIVLHTWLTGLHGRRRWVDLLKIEWLKRSSIVVAVSNAIRQQCWPDAIVINNPYQDNLYKIDPTVERNKLFVFLGRLVSDKGVELAIKAFHKVVLKEQSHKSLFIDFTLTVIGDGPEKSNLEGLVNELKLQDYVFFAGTLRGKELVQNLNKHKFMVVPSIWEEPFGIVALEGMACGCIPIVSDGGGLPEAIGNAGLIFKRGDVNSLAECFSRVLKNDELASKISLNSKAHLLDHHQKSVVIKYLTLIESTFKK